MSFKEEFKFDEMYADFESCRGLRLVREYDDSSEKYLSIHCESFEFKDMVIHVTCRKIFNCDWSFVYVFSIRGNIVHLTNNGVEALNYFDMYKTYLNPYEF